MVRAVIFEVSSWRVVVEGPGIVKVVLTISFSVVLITTGAGMTVEKEVVVKVWVVDLYTSGPVKDVVVDILSVVDLETINISRDVVTTLTDVLVEKIVDGGPVGVIVSVTTTTSPSGTKGEMPRADVSIQEILEKKFASSN